jgi:hypothetical protein
MHHLTGKIPRHDTKLGQYEEARGSKIMLAIDPVLPNDAKYHTFFDPARPHPAIDGRHCRPMIPLRPSTEAMVDG